MKNSIKPFFSGDWLTGKSNRSIYQRHLEYTRSILLKKSLSEEEVRCLWAKIDNTLDNLLQKWTKNDPELKRELMRAHRMTGLAYYGTNAAPRMGASDIEDINLLVAGHGKENEDILELFREYGAPVLFAVIALHEAAVGRKDGFRETIIHLDKFEKIKSQNKAREFFREKGSKSRKRTYNYSLQQLINLLYQLACRNGLKINTSNVLKPLERTSRHGEHLDTEMFTKDRHLANRIDNVFTDDKYLYWTDETGKEALISKNTIRNHYLPRAKKIKK